MHKRFVSYVLFLATIAAVFMVVVIQPRNTVFHKLQAGQADRYYGADTCMMGNGISCEEYAAMMAAASACSGNGGTWNWTTNQCVPAASSCNGTSCNQMTCEMAGYYWDGSSCYLTNPGNGSGSSSSSDSPVALGGVSANEKLSQRIESECLAHVERSGYAPIIKKYGWFNNVRVYANNACTYAYLSTNGKFSSNNDLYLVADLVARDNATRAEDIGLLYTALENAPAEKDKQSLDDYLNPDKDGIAKYLKSVMEIMAEFNDRSSTPAYLVNPLPYVTAHAAADWNKANGTHIVSLEEKFIALLPKTEEAAAEQPNVPAPEKITEEPVPAAEHPATVTKAEPAEETPLAPQRVGLLTKILNKLKGIRDDGIENGIERKAVTPDLGELQKDFEYQQELIGTFNEAHEKLCAQIGC